MKDLVLHLVAVIAAFYAVLFLGLACVGVLERQEYSGACDEPKIRIEYVFPAFRIGCWLGESVE